MPSILDDIAGLLDAQEARGVHPSAIVLGTDQTQALEDELRPYMIEARCPHLCDAICLRHGCDHAHGSDEEWLGINRNEAATLYGVSLVFADARSRLAIEVA